MCSLNWFFHDANYTPMRPSGRCKQGGRLCSEVYKGLSSCRRHLWRPWSQTHPRFRRKDRDLELDLGPNDCEAHCSQSNGIIRAGEGSSIRG